MKISTFLISSAAMLAVSASNASAADAMIAAEPDPVEYVRVCDAFGSGYFYIPGTETCLKFSGEVRLRVSGGSEKSTLEYKENTDLERLTQERSAAIAVHATIFRAESAAAVEQAKEDLAAAREVRTEEILVRGNGKNVIEENIQGGADSPAVAKAKADLARAEATLAAIDKASATIASAERALKAAPAKKLTLTNDGGNSFSTAARARVTLDAKSDTEFGELHAKLRLQAQNDGTPGTDAAFEMDQGYLQLGGLFAGYSESAWVYSTNGGATGFGGKGIYDGNYGYQQRNMIQYQINGGNFFAAISLEDDKDKTSRIPDYVGRLGGKFGGVTVFGVLAYDQNNGRADEVWKALYQLDTGKSGKDDKPAVERKFGAKLGLNADIGEAGNLVAQGFYASGNTAYGANLGFVGQTWTPTWSGLVAYGHQLSEDINAHVTGQYFADFYTPGGKNSGMDAWEIAGGLKWTPVTNFSVSAAGKYTQFDSGTYFKRDTVDTSGLKEGMWNFALQVQRNF